MAGVEQSETPHLGRQSSPQKYSPGRARSFTRISARQPRQGTTFTASIVQAYEKAVGYPTRSLARVPPTNGADLAVQLRDGRVPVVHVDRFLE